MSRVELTFVSRDDEHVKCTDDIGMEFELPEYLFDGIPKLWKEGQMILANLSEEQIEMYDIFT